MTRALCVWFPAWPIQRLRAARPELRGAAVVVFDENSRRGQRVKFGSAEAAKAGVTPGMPVAEARTFFEGRAASRKSWHCLPSDPPADRAALQRLAWSLLTFSPHVGLEETESPESLLLDVAGCDALFGGEAALLSRLRHTLLSGGYDVRIALADTIGAAWGASHFARTAVTLIPPGRHRGFLAPLPPAALRLPARVLSTLDELGLSTIGKLSALPRDALPSRFGPEILRRLDQARGDCPEPIVCEHPPEPVELSQAFDVPLENRRDVETVMRRLLAGILTRLQADGRGTQRLLVRLSLESGDETCLEAGLVSATASAKRLEEVLGLAWERTEITSGVIRVTMRAVDPVPLPTRAGTLFADVCENPASEWESLLERLSNRLGEEAVVRSELVADHTPERSFHWVPVTSSAEGGWGQSRGGLGRNEGGWGRSAAKPPAGRSRTASSKGRGLAKPRPQPPAAKLPPADEASAPENPPSTRLRPLILLAPPRPIAVIRGLEGESPLHLRWPGYAAAVAHSSGPERLETGWWRDEGIRRDYYRIETTDGSRFWIFRDLATRAWFLHGHFG